MATIRLKRGTSTPTTSNLSFVGEVAFNYNSNELFVRNAAGVAKIGGELEKVLSYEGNTPSYSFTMTFNIDYIYKVHVIAATNGGNADVTKSIINYMASSLSSYKGSYVNIKISDLDGVITDSLKNTSDFIISDEFTNTVSDQSNAPITYTQFAHTIDGTPIRLKINPGLELGPVDSLSVTVYRIKRK